MTLKLKKTVKQMLAEANAEIETVSAADAINLKGDPDLVFVDIRDIRELDREGRIPGAFHAPRGMLEFWVDPESPYHKEIFASGQEIPLLLSGRRQICAGSADPSANGTRTCLSHGRWFYGMESCWRTGGGWESFVMDMGFAHYFPGSNSRKYW